MTRSAEVAVSAADARSAVLPALLPNTRLTPTSITSRPFSQTEKKFEERKGPLKPGRRLSCHTTLLDDAVIDVPAESQVHRQIVRKEMESRDIRLDTATRLYYVQIEEPSLDDARGEVQFLLEALERID